jgi:signal transduction histidine kinase
MTKSEARTGLGLYISKNIIEANKRIYNPNGKGATFEFTLPIENNQN